MRTTLPLPTVTTVLACVAAALATGPSPAGAQEGIRLDGAMAEAGAEEASRGNSRRLIVIQNADITPETLARLGDFGQIHGWIDRYRLVAMTPSGKTRSRIRALPFVRSVEPDVLRQMADVASWDRDIIDVSDVEESDSVGDPDAREVAETGAGVHVAIVDTGLIERWRDFLPEERVASHLGRAFMGGGTVGEDFVPANEFHTSNPTNLWERDTHSHGTAVASHVAGFKIGAMRVDGVAPGARIIPLKVFPNGEASTWSSRTIAAIGFVVDLVESRAIGRAVINLSLGSGAPSAAEEAAIHDAVASGVVVVASAGNRGEAGMGYPGAHPQVISVGAIGWTLQFRPGSPETPNLGFWWNQDVGYDPERGHGPFEQEQAYVSLSSSRALAARGQELDLLAPGARTVAPGGHGPQAGYFFWSGTSFSSPLVAGAAALLLEKNPTLRQHQVEAILKGSAHPLERAGERVDVLDPFAGGILTFSWDTDCGGLLCDPVGAGLVQVDDALAATPTAR
jgi:subtilisin family serine protease